MSNDNNNEEVRDMMGVDPREVCSHFNLVPFVQVAGKLVWQGGQSYIDWSSNIINAHYLKTTKFFCPACGKVIEAPSELDAEKGVY